MDKAIQVFALVDGKPVIDIKHLDGDFPEVPWSKISTNCNCGSNRAFFYVTGGDYRKDCPQCGIITMYSGKVFNTPPEELEKCFRFPAPDQSVS
jgi:hypothetical protein